MFTDKIITLIWRGEWGPTHYKDINDHKNKTFFKKPAPYSV